MKISKDFKFEASHVLSRHPGKCSRLHGHSWQGKVTVIGDVNPGTGFVMDYYDLGQILQKHIVDPLDHKHLGVFEQQFEPWKASPFQVPVTWRAPVSPKFYPSSENLLRWIVKQLRPDLPNLYEVRLQETCTSEAIWSISDVFEPDYGAKLNVDVFDRPIN